MSGGLTFSDTSRKDPYKTFNFRVSFVGKRRIAKAGFSFVSGVKASVELAEITEGGRSDFVHRAIQRVNYEPIVMERGASQDHDLIKVFAGQFDVMQGGMMLTKDDNLAIVKIEQLDRDGKTVVRTTELQGVIVVGYEEPDRDAMSSESFIERITIRFQHVDIK
ncbi:T4-like virus tail tube protein gp19 [compost metagenome]